MKQYVKHYPEQSFTVKYTINGSMNFVAYHSTGHLINDDGSRTPSYQNKNSDSSDFTEDLDLAEHTFEGHMICNGLIRYAFNNYVHIYSKGDLEDLKFIMDQIYVEAATHPEFTGNIEFREAVED